MSTVLSLTPRSESQRLWFRAPSRYALVYCLAMEHCLAMQMGLLLAHHLVHCLAHCLVTQKAMLMACHLVHCLAMLMEHCLVK